MEISSQYGSKTSTSGPEHQQSCAFHFQSSTAKICLKGTHAQVQNYNAEDYRVGVGPAEQAYPKKILALRSGFW